MGHVYDTCQNSALVITGSTFLLGTPSTKFDIDFNGNRNDRRDRKSNCGWRKKNEKSKRPIKDNRKGKCKFHSHRKGACYDLDK